MRKHLHCRIGVLLQAFQYAPAWDIKNLAALLGLDAHRRRASIEQTLLSEELVRSEDRDNEFAGFVTVDKHLCAARQQHNTKRPAALLSARYARPPDSCGVGCTTSKQRIANPTDSRKAAGL
jgi:hypothetical protein